MRSKLPRRRAARTRLGVLEDVLRPARDGHFFGARACLFLGTFFVCRDPKKRFRCSRPFWRCFGATGRAVRQTSLQLKLRLRCALATSVGVTTNSRSSARITPDTWPFRVSRTNTPSRAALISPSRWASWVYATRRSLLRDQVLPAASLGPDDNLTLTLRQHLAAAIGNNPERTQATTCSKPRPSCRTWFSGDGGPLDPRIRSRLEPKKCCPTCA